MPYNSPGVFGIELWSWPMATTPARRPPKCKSLMLRTWVSVSTGASCCPWPLPSPATSADSHGKAAHSLARRAPAVNLLVLIFGTVGTYCTIESDEAHLRLIDVVVSNSATDIDNASGAGRGGGEMGRRFRRPALLARHSSSRNLCQWILWARPALL